MKSNLDDTKALLHEAVDELNYQKSLARSWRKNAEEMKELLASAFGTLEM